jgi:glc operon protein GlcG
MADKSFVKDAKTLTLAGGLAVLNAAIVEAEKIGQPMCISVVDTGGNLLAFGRMDGSKALSVISTRNKAVTAALSNEPTGGAHADVELQVTLAQENKWTNLIGGLPIRVDGFVLGAVAAGSGTGTQDLAVARAGDCRRRDVPRFPAEGRRGHRHHPGELSGEGAWLIPRWHSPISRPKMPRRSAPASAGASCRPAMR